jgi:chromosome segregation ATPase
MLVVIGYSVPATDQLSQALLRADVNKLSALVVANPDPEARRRVIDVMSSALESTASVVELQTIEEFASYLPPSPNESPPVDPLAELARLRRQMRLGLRELAQAQAQLEESHRGLEEEQGELRATVEEVEATVEDLSSCEDEVRKLTDEVRDIDARIDSILG